MRSLKKAFNEQNLMVIVFVMVFAAFAFAQKESKKIEKLYLGFRLHNGTGPHFTSAAEKQPDSRIDTPGHSGEKMVVN